MLITTPRLHLRRFEPRDLPEFFAYRNDPQVARFQSWSALGEAELSAFIDEMAQAEPGVPGPGFQFAVARAVDNLLIGDVYFKLLDHDRRQAEIGYTLARIHQGNGYASEAVRGVLRYAFERLELHRVIALVDCANHASVALLERVAMRREAHFLQHWWSHGAYRDEYQYALLHSEWRRQEAR
ncbi:MAG: GNAT family N-acetyltransferase [Oscillochloris sp.]|nr:GNAT family N-acetyltransferase [Oscillochloris sp.]